ncbi:hypothetical protein HYU15_04035 [Candidatus Woesearchaeota archaeon]|nr:hypothetical protein [Candidatus Woesearchaeota archaeon]
MAVSVDAVTEKSFLEAGGATAFPGMRRLGRIEELFQGESGNQEELKKALAGVILMDTRFPTATAVFNYTVVHVSGLYGQEFYQVVGDVYGPQ